MLYVRQQVTSVMMRELVFIGGGHSHAIALQLWGQNPLPDVLLTLISDVPETPYSGMLPGHIAGFYSHAECHIDLRSLCQFANATFIVDKAIGLNLDKNEVICYQNEPIKFDLLSIDIGSTPATLSVPGAAENTIPVKPVPQFLSQWERLLEDIAQKPPASLRLGIVGGGAGGVELALSMQSRLRPLLPNLEIHLFHRDAELMPNHNQWVRHQMQKILTRRGIMLHLEETVCKVEPHWVVGESGLRVECDSIFWVTQASAPDWLKAAGLATDPKGFILVNDFLQSISHPQVFAAGDIATDVNHPCPKAGVFAVRQGKPLLRNLRHQLLGQPLKPYKPQQRYLSLIGTGNSTAVASWGSFGWGPSPLLWFWKDYLDRQFMNQFH